MTTTRRAVLAGGSLLTSAAFFRNIPIAALMTIAPLIFMPLSASAQTPGTGATSAPPPGKSSVKTDMVPSLFVMNAHGASLHGQTLTLDGVSPNSIVFADRPVRAAGHLLTQHLLEEWTEGSFAKDPPNATVSVMSQGWRLGTRRGCRAQGSASRRRQADL
jgi:hypothetical protein